jgi:hypothetical protein
MVYSALERTLLLLIALGVVCLTKSSASAVTSYHIGNSLTNHSNPDTFELYAESRGVELHTGYNLHGGWALNDFLADPNNAETIVDEYGPYSSALVNNHWDIVTLQPHRSFPGTQMHQDISSILSFIDLTRSNPANADTNFYIFQTWPELSGNYQQAWTAPVLDHPSTASTRSRDYFNYLIEHVRAQTDANVYMIPAGEVFYELDKKIRSKEIPGFVSVNDFYGDLVHMRTETGRYISSMTMYSTIMGQYPNQLSKPTGYFTGPQTVTPQQEAMFQEVIRQVIDSNPYTSVDLPPPLRADFNGDGRVDSFDLTLWERSRDISGPYDIDFDGDVDGRDFLTWQRTYRPGLSPAQQVEFDLADLNDDGAVNGLDVEQWRNSYRISDSGDMDGDGDTDGRDFLIWQRLPAAVDGDLNRDFLIDGFELESWTNSFGFESLTDANQDGVVDLEDYEIWESENGRTWNFPFADSSPLNPQGLSALNSVPEPGAISLLTIGLMYAAGHRRRQSR